MDSEGREEADLFAGSGADDVQRISTYTTHPPQHATTGWGWLAGSLAIQISRIQSMGVWNGKAMSRRIAQSDR